MAQIYVNLAWRGGIPETRKKSIMAVFCFSNGAMIFVNMAMFIWGAVIIGQEYGTWTKLDKTSKFYCRNTPFMSAIVIVALKLVSPRLCTFRREV